MPFFILHVHLQQDMKWIEVNESSWVCVFTIYNSKCLCLLFSNQHHTPFNSFHLFLRISIHFSTACFIIHSHSFDSFIFVCRNQIIFSTWSNEMWSKRLFCMLLYKIIEISMFASHRWRERKRERTMKHNIIGSNGKWDFYYVNTCSHIETQIYYIVLNSVFLISLGVQSFLRRFASFRLGSQKVSHLYIQYRL